jgi:hypothetical protein
MLGGHGNGLMAAQRLHRQNQQAPHRALGWRAYSRAEGRTRAGGFRSFHSPYYSQNFGWPSAYNGFWAYPFAPEYAHLPYLPYLYFYDRYAQEAERSRHAADEFEASLAREGKLTGPATVGSLASDSRPLLPRDVALTLDDQPVAPSASSGPVVIGSGRHTLRIAARAAE